MVCSRPYVFLGYKNFSSINKAHTVFNALDIDITENIERIQRDVNGVSVKDYKLTRFACYLIVMNCDVRKPEVAEAQAHFAQMAVIIRDYMEKATQLERVTTRRWRTAFFIQRIFTIVSRSALISPNRQLNSSTLKLSS